MKTLTILLGRCILAFALLTTTTVIAADFSERATGQYHSQSVIPIPDISKKMRREAGPVVAEVDEEESSSGSRGRFSFKRGKSGFAAFSQSRGRFSFKRGKSGFAAFSQSRGRFSFKRGKSGFAAFSQSRGRFAFKRGKSGFAAFSQSRGRFAFKRGKSGFAAFSQSRGSEQTLKKTVQNADKTEALPTKIRLPLIIAPLTPQRSLGLTMTDQPTLYWYMSYWWEGDLEFSLNEFGASEPIIEYTVQRNDCNKHPIQDDLICQLRLADSDVRLKPNKDYEWFVFIVMDPEQRTSDWLASAFLHYTKPSTRLTSRLEQTPLSQRYQVYKENGFWYDALDNLGVQIEKQPNNNALRKKLKVLIEQEKMLNVAEFLEEGCEECYHEIDID